VLLYGTGTRCASKCKIRMIYIIYKCVCVCVYSYILNLATFSPPATAPAIPRVVVVVVVVFISASICLWKDKTTRRHPVRRAFVCIYTLYTRRYKRGHVRAFIIITTIMNALGRPLTRSASLTFIIVTSR